MSGLLMGALGGLGKGLVKQSERLEANERKRDYLEMQRQIDIEREKRIEEATIRAEGRREQASIRGEQRQAQNQRAQRHETLEFATDPDNVRRLTRAEIAKKQAADAYADRRAPIETQQAADRAAAIQQATYRDTTDYEGRRLAHERARLEIEAFKTPSAKMSDSDQKRYDFLKDELKRLDKRYTDTNDEIEKVELKKEMSAVKAEVYRVLGDAEDDSPSKADPVAIALQNEALKNEIKRIAPDIDVELSADKAEKPGVDALMQDNTDLKALLSTLKKGGERIGGKEAVRQRLIEELKALTHNRFEIPSDATVDQLQGEIDRIRKEIEDYTIPQERTEMDKTKWGVRAGRGLLEFGARKRQQWRDALDAL